MGIRRYLRAKGLGHLQTDAEVFGRVYTTKLSFAAGVSFCFCFCRFKIKGIPDATSRCLVF